MIGASNRNIDYSPFIQFLLHKSDAEGAETAAADLAAGKNGYLLQNDNGKKQYVYYEPLTEIKNCSWVMATVVDQSAVAERVRTIQSGIILLCIAVICIAIILICSMSHDMRTPLNGIIGMTYLTQEMELPQKARENLEKIDTSSKFLLSLINDVLDMVSVRESCWRQPFSSLQQQSREI